MIAFLVTVLVNAAWQPALIALIAFIALRLSHCTNATTRHAIWTIALAASVAVPFISAMSLAVPARAAAPVTAAAHAGVTRVHAATSAPAHLTIAVVHPTITVAPTIAQLAAAAWGVAVLLVLGRLLFSFLYLERLKHSALPLSVDRRNALLRWERADKGLRDVRICVAQDIKVPVAIGIFDAMILLPEDLVSELAPADLDHILLHELAHVRRYDDWVNLFERIALGVFFFSPGIHWIARQMDLECEVACDDWVLAAAEKVAYARILARIVETMQWPHRGVAAPGVFATRKGMSIRIERLLAKSRDIRTSLRLAPTLVAFAAIAAIVVAGGFVSPTIAYTLNTQLKLPARSHVVAQRKPALHSAAAGAPTPIARVAAAAPTPAPTMAPRIVKSAMPVPPAKHPQNARIAYTPAPPRHSPRPAPTAESGRYLDELQAAGLTNLDPDTIIELKALNVSADYIAQMRAAGLGAIEPRQFGELKSLNIDPAYVTQMRNAGITPLDPQVLMELKSMGITPQYVRDIANTGASIPSRDLAGLKSMNVTAQYITDLAKAGYPNLSAAQYESLKALGIDADYVRTLAAHGFEHLSIDKLEELKAMKVIPK